MTQPVASASEPAKPRRRRILTLWNLVRWVLLVILLTELGLRWIFGLGNPVLVQPDRYCEYLPTADQHVWRFFAHNDINHFHMRSDPIPADGKKLPGHYRVLFVGDSVTYGTTYVDQAKIFTSLLARDPGLPELTDSARPTVDVLNASAGGWAPINELGFLRGYGTFDSDLVVFVLNTGDLNQTISGYVDSPVSPSHKPLCAISETWSHYVKPRLLGNYEPVDAGSVAVFVPNFDTVTQQVRAQLSDAAMLAKTHGARFAVVYSPARGPDWETPAYQKALAMLHNWAIQQNVPLVDLTADYAGHSTDEVYFPGGIHLRPLGHQLVAARLKKEWPTLVR